MDAFPLKSTLGFAAGFWLCEEGSSQMYSTMAGPRCLLLPRSLLLASGPVLAALIVSLLLSHIAHIQLPVYAQVHLYGAIFAAARIGGLYAGFAAFGLALGLSDFFLTEPLYELFTIDDLPDFVTFGLTGGGSVWIGYLGRKIADDRQQNWSF